MLHGSSKRSSSSGDSGSHSSLCRLSNSSLGGCWNRHANRSSIRSRICCVRLHVASKVDLLRGAIIALIAGKWLITRVSELMPDQVGSARSTIFAFVAREGLVTSVRALMASQRRHVGTAKITIITRKRLVTRMSSFMSDQVRIGITTIVAKFALEWFFTIVISLVLR